MMSISANANVIQSFLPPNRNSPDSEIGNVTGCGVNTSIVACTPLFLNLSWINIAISSGAGGHLYGPPKIPITSRPPLNSLNAFSARGISFGSYTLYACSANPGTAVWIQLRTQSDDQRVRLDSFSVNDSRLLLRVDRLNRRPPHIDPDPAEAIYRLLPRLKRGLHPSAPNSCGTQP